MAIFLAGSVAAGAELRLALRGLDHRVYQLLAQGFAGQHLFGTGGAEGDRPRWTNGDGGSDDLIQCCISVTLAANPKMGSATPCGRMMRSNALAWRACRCGKRNALSN